MRITRVSMAALAAAFFAFGNEPVLVGQQPTNSGLTMAAFEKLHTLIKPQSGELRFQEIPWLIDVWEARKKAAAEGKPILAWSGAGGAPIGVC
jgi:hypothetical protein